jgi:quinol-cytochrome oxidoreductase complex cytochrome b subunit
MLGYLPAVGELLHRAVLGGSEVGPATLIIFYTIHTAIVPAALIVLMGFHFWRVRRAGGVVMPPAGADQPESKSEKVLFLPHLLFREVVQGLVLVALVVALAAAFGAPLGERANPGMSPNPAKAPWYFVGFQELLIHLHPTFAVLVIPLAAALGLLLLPYLTSDDEPSGRWLLSATGRRTAAAALAAALTLTPALVVLDELVAGGAESWLVGGLLPTALLGAALTGVFFVTRRRFRATTNEAVQAVVVLLAVAFAVLTLVGVWFRGEGMALTWPWAG